MRKRTKPGKRRPVYLIGKLAIAALAIAIAYAAILAWQVTREFDQRGWDLPAQVFAAPLEIYPGRRIDMDDAVVELVRLGYRESAALQRPGTFARRDGRLGIRTRSFAMADSVLPERRVEIGFSGDSVRSVSDEMEQPIPILELDPMLIGSVFPAHGEDRIILRPDEIPDVLARSLKAVEDRRFDDHFGLDLRAIARATLVNLTQGEIQQGGSTLTQQLVRSYFLTTERTWSRKLREAFMAVALELRHDKDELMTAYINEVYLAQDGARAIHGFGLASRFYFGKPLSELDLHEIALLVAQVRGPSYYDPRRHPDRAVARRNLVLMQMRDLDIIDERSYEAARGQPLDIVNSGRRSSYYAAFIELVRRQLRNDYAAEDLQATGLRIFSTLDPAVQSSAETAVMEELDQIQNGRPDLEAAAVVTDPHTAEILAVVGSRRTGFDGFNRALDARRQIGSLIKPAVYLAAIESDEHTLASLVDDSPISVPMDDGSTWSPRNFNDESHGTVTAVRALAESFNMATVRIGLEAGVDKVADVLQRLGLDKTPLAYPSLLLGAIELTPIEVTQIYNTLANGGFRMPLRAVRAVVAADGTQLQRFPIEMRSASDPMAIYGLNQALVQVMQRGTGKSAQQRLRRGLTTAGKTGTSDDLRDSWFAGFTGNRLVVAWIGNDANEPVGLTGSSGAARVFSHIVTELDTVPYHAPVPGGLEQVWIDYATGLETEPGCESAVSLAMHRSELPPQAVSCGSTKTRFGSRLRRFFRNAGR